MNLSKLAKLKVGDNHLTHLAADDVAAVLLHNPSLKEIDLSDNKLLSAGVIKIFNAIKDMFTLSCINISHNEITNRAANDIAAVLAQSTHLRKFCLAKNYFKTNGIITLCKGMGKISHLTHLDMSSNKITDEAAHDIANLLFHNPVLKELDLSNTINWEMFKVK